MVLKQKRLLSLGNKRRIRVPLYNSKTHFHPIAELSCDHLDDSTLETMNKTLLTIGLALVASVTYAGPKWRVTRVKPNL